MNATPDSRYRPDIDALRAFAVLPVVLFHLGASWLPGGFLGVDVFFVISGYLISSLLLRELRQGHINLWAFWRRRILRILPALLVMVLVTFAAGHVLLYAPDRYLLAVNAAGALLSVGNITHWRNYGGYWSGDANDSPFLHTWSLGVEEQFYILYPLALLMAWRLLKDRTWLLLVAGLLAGTMLYIVASQRSPSAAFYLFPTRAWELLAGAVAASANLRRMPSERTGKVMAQLGLVLVCIAYAFATEDWQVPGAMLAVTGAALVVVAGSSAGFDRWHLTSRPIVLIGLISYSVYLWHWPLIVLGEALQAQHQVHIAPVFILVTSLAMGWLSWRFIEMPVRHARATWVPLTVLFAAVLSGGGYLRHA
jgi:peptidoglycan/LPS O-acetylase OafA/YrhL